MIMFSDLIITSEDLDYLPEEIANPYVEKILEYKKRLEALVDKFAVAIYATHILGAIITNSKAEIFEDDETRAARLVENAEPGEVATKAYHYAMRVCIMEAEILWELCLELRAEIKEIKGKHK